MPPAPARRTFSGEEHLKLEEIIQEMGRNSIRWAAVVKRLAEAGFAERTAKSVRNHYLRMRQFKRMQPEQTNYCRICKLPQRGHVCLGKKKVAPPKAVVGDNSEE